MGRMASAAILIAIVFPAIARTGNAIAADRTGVSEQSSEEIRLVNALSELDASGSWLDTDSDSLFDVWVWVKNTGAETVRSVNEMDVFVHGGGTSARIPHSSVAGGSNPQWAHAVEGGGTWLVDITLKITIHYATAVAADDYAIEVATPRGANATGTFPF